MLLAEDLLLLLLDDESGHVGGWDNKTTDIALASAVMADLVISGAVEISDPTRFLKSSTVRFKDASGVIDPIQRDALDLVAAKEQKTSSAISQLRNGLRDRLLSRLVERGIVQRQVARHWVVLTRSTWPAIDVSHEKSLRSPIEEALFSAGQLTEREAVLVRLLAESANLHTVFPAGKVEEPYLRRAVKNVQLHVAVQAMTDRICTQPGLKQVFTACDALMPSAD